MLSSRSLGKKLWIVDGGFRLRYHRQNALGLRRVWNRHLSELGAEAFQRQQGFTHCGLHIFRAVGADEFLEDADAQTLDVTVEAGSIVRDGVAEADGVVGVESRDDAVYQGHVFHSLGERAQLVEGP